jgi:hypothetical protein
MPTLFFNQGARVIVHHTRYNGRKGTVVRELPAGLCHDKRVLVQIDGIKRPVSVLHYLVSPLAEYEELHGPQ